MLMNLCILVYLTWRMIVCVLNQDLRCLMIWFLLIVTITYTSLAGHNPRMTRMLRMKITKVADRDKESRIQTDDKNESWKHLEKEDQQETRLGSKQEGPLKVIFGGPVLVITAQASVKVACVPAQTMANDGGGKVERGELMLLPVGSVNEEALFVLFKMLVFKLASILDQNPD